MVRIEMILVLVILQNLWKHVLVVGNANKGGLIDPDERHVAMILSITYGPP
jgi:hypothetical protein